jgi:DNA-binding MarR family transcriptional regulator
MLAAMGTLRLHGPMTPSELARKEAIRRPTATGLIARLEELGFATREQDPSDGRSWQVQLTSDGSRLLASVRRRQSEYMSQALGRLHEDEIAVLDRATTILESLLEYEGTR